MEPQYSRVVLPEFAGGSLLRPKDLDISSENGVNLLDALGYGHSRCIENLAHLSC